MTLEVVRDTVIPDHSIAMYIDEHLRANPEVAVAAKNRSRPANTNKQNKEEITIDGAAATKIVVEDAGRNSSRRRARKLFQQKFSVLVWSVSTTLFVHMLPR